MQKKGNISASYLIKKRFLARVKKFLKLGLALNAETTTGILYRMKDAI